MTSPPWQLRTTHVAIITIADETVAVVINSNIINNIKRNYVQRDKLLFNDQKLF